MSVAAVVLTVATAIVGYVCAVSMITYRRVEDIGAQVDDVRREVARIERQVREGLS